MTPAPYDYSARTAYDYPGVGETYESERFSGVMGRYRRRRELRAVGELVHRLPSGITMLDCPCGTGRWWPLLAERASAIVATDISAAMRAHAVRRAPSFEVPVEVVEGDAEALPLDDDSVDYVFSFALTKHLPVPIQYDVLREFRRVARRGVLCSFGVFSHLTYEVWRRRSLVESYPVIREELGWMAASVGLHIEAMRKCTTPIGVEHIVLFSCVE